MTDDSEDHLTLAHHKKYDLKPLVVQPHPDGSLNGLGNGQQTMIVAVVRFEAVAMSRKGTRKGHSYQLDVRPYVAGSLNGLGNEQQTIVVAVVGSGCSG